MKVNVEVTCTPEEARAFFGLPDLGPMQQRVMGEIEERLRNSLNAMNPETIFKTWLPASMQGQLNLGFMTYRTYSIVLIVVGVVLDTVRQIEAQMVMRNYSGFLT